MIRVKATQPGYHGTYREEHDEFAIENETAFSKVWMVRLDAPKVEVKLTQQTEKSK
jgi:hypothetical protein